MSILDDFTDYVLPQMPLAQRSRFLTKYPFLRLGPQPGFVPAVDLPVLMLVALTGTGKSTTLQALEKLRGDAPNIGTLPTRRDLADFMVMPTVQYLTGVPIEHVTDRARRFAYKQLFAQYVPGGMAAIYTALYSVSVPVQVSEGVRGAEEITVALDHAPNWHILELSLNPITRLKRLSSRRSRFDRVETTRTDLSFLPEAMQPEAQALLDSGKISGKAITIMQAEAQNYGLYPAMPPHPRYHVLVIDDLESTDIARKLADILETMQNVRD